ncbi:MAG: hypothetical protein J7L88_03345 [Thermoplasmata archaeon]|nr:hypothetical protein [Thermoplasmata archaeon]
MNRVLTLVAYIVFVAFLFSIATELRDFGEPVMDFMDKHFLDKGQEETGANNIVTSVVFDYRGFDTLGEATVLFAAVSGVIIVYRRLKK